MSNIPEPQDLTAGSGALAVLLPRGLFPQIDTWRERYDPAHMQLPPHVTLMYPPFVRHSDWPVERPRLAELLASLPAFDVILAETGSFLAPQRVLWLKPEDDGMFEQTEGAIRGHFGLPPAPPPFEFTPHVTLAFFDDEAALRRAEEEVRRELAPLHFRADRIGYFVDGGAGNWRVADELRLGTP